MSTGSPQSTWRPSCARSLLDNAPATPPARPVESEADFLKRLHRMVTEGEAKRTPVSPAEADELRTLGLMEVQGKDGHSGVALC